MDFEKIKKTFERRRYTVSCFETKEEAADYVVGKFEGETIGFGGSVTLDQMGLYERLREKNTVLWHHKEPETRRRFGEYTVYLSSVNAVAETGEMVNIDGTGNRLSATLFGPKRVMFLVGKNKIVPDLPAAMTRARSATIPNAKRLHRNVPCIAAGKCVNCLTPERLCCAMTIYMMKMKGFEEVEIVFINEDLGF